MSTPQTKLPVPDFAKRVREKYPEEYADVPDTELVDRVVRKYPQYKDAIDVPSFDAPTTSKWGAKRSYGGHTGTDLGYQRGERIGAPAKGRVTFAGTRDGYGNRVEVAHGFGKVTTYSHLDAFDVREGDEIEEGQPLGRVGSTGGKYRPHLHYEVLEGGRKLNPEETIYRPRRVTGDAPQLQTPPGTQTPPPLALPNRQRPQAATQVAPPPLVYRKPSPAGYLSEEDEAKALAESPLTVPPPTVRPRLAAPDLRTQEGRAARDARNAMERAPDSAYVVNVQPEVDPMREVVARLSKETDIPEEYAEQWIRAQGVYDADSGERLEGMPRASLLNVSAPDVERMKRDYRDSLSLPQRAVRNVSEVLSDVSPGEVLAGVATEGGKSALRGLDLASRPLQAASGGFWAKVRGAHDLAAVKTAYDEFVGENPGLGKNVIAEALRQSDTLKDINPRVPELTGFLAEMVADPANLIPAGLIAKGATKLGRGAAEGSRMAKLADGMRDIGVYEPDIPKEAFKPSGDPRVLGDLTRRVDTTGAPLPDVPAASPPVALRPQLNKPSVPDVPVATPDAARVVKRTVRHADPKIDGGEIIRERGDGKLEVRNNEGGVSVIQHPRKQGNQQATIVREKINENASQADTTPSDAVLADARPAGAGDSVPDRLGDASPVREQGQQTVPQVAPQDAQPSAAAELNASPPPQAPLPRAGEGQPLDSAKLKEAFKSSFNLDEPRAAAVADLVDARARAWAKEATGRSESDYIPSRFAGVVKGGEVGAGALYQEAAPTFYSQLRKVADTMPAKAKASDAARYLSDPQRGVRADELKWTGLDDYLREKAGRSEAVTKEEVQRFLDENEVKVEEVVKGGEMGFKLEVSSKLSLDELKQIAKPFVDSHHRDVQRGFGEGAYEIVGLSKKDAEQLSARLRDDHAATVNELPLGERQGKASTTKFSQYTLPGAKEGSYRELLLTLSTKSRSVKEINAGFDGLKRALERNDIGADEYDRRYQVLVKERSATNETAYKSSHYDEPNILAHVRFNERVDATGKRVLFIEEIQSDWHQAGRKKGYQGQHVTELPPGYEVRSEAHDGRTYYYGVDGSGNRLTARAGSAEAVREGMLVDFNNSKGIKVPAAPFSKTWHELAMKRVLRHAAENGYDRVAWTKGETQAARYDLSKQLDSIHGYRDESGKYWFEANRKGYGDSDNYITKKGLTEAELEENIGKDAANNLLRLIDENENLPKGRVKKSRVTLRGENLKVGGEGMAGFYDRILPSFAQKYGRKWGARVGETEIPTGGELSGRAKPVEVSGRWRMEDASGKRWGSFQSREEAVRAWRDEMGAKPAHSLDITPQMRESVMAGQPLFQENKAAVEFLRDGRAILRGFQKADVSSAVHEFAHVFRRDLSPDLLRDAEEAIGVKGGQWSKPDEEKFARGFERYLKTGEAPSTKLQAVFESFKNWLTEIYGAVRGKNHPLGFKPNGQLVAVFDRALGGAPKGEHGQVIHQLYKAPDADTPAFFANTSVRQALGLKPIPPDASSSELSAAMKETATRLAETQGRTRTSQMHPEFLERWSRQNKVDEEGLRSLRYATDEAAKKVEAKAAEAAPKKAGKVKIPSDVPRADYEWDAVDAPVVKGAKMRGQPSAEVFKRGVRMGYGEVLVRGEDGQLLMSKNGSLLYSPTLSDLQQWHYGSVKDALDLGVSVRPEVLKDYPDLAAQYGKDVDAEDAPALPVDSLPDKVIEDLYAGRIQPRQFAADARKAGVPDAEIRAIVRDAGEYRAPKDAGGAGEKGGGGGAVRGAGRGGRDGEGDVEPAFTREPSESPRTIGRFDPRRAPDLVDPEVARAANRIIADEGATWQEALRRAEAETGRASNAPPDVLYQSPETAGRQTDTPEFKRWFGGSKVVDERGEPMVVYHGTPADFSTFDARGDIGPHFGSYDAAEGRLTELNKQRAGFKPGSNVMPVYARIANPLRMRDMGAWNDPLDLAGELRSRRVIDQAEYNRVFDATEDAGGTDAKGIKELRSILESKGHDGIVYRNEHESRDDSFIPFKPEQIKSATGNRGTFDPDNPNILYQSAPSQIAQRAREAARRAREGAAKPEAAPKSEGLAPRQTYSAVRPPAGTRIPAPRPRVEAPAPVLRKPTLGEQLVDAANAPRALKSSIDLSASMRQGAMFTLTHPGRASRIFFGQQLRSLSNKGYEKFVAEMKADPDVALMQDSGLHLTSLAPDKIGNREEAFASKLAGRVPLVQRSEHAYVTFLDSARSQWFKQLKGQAEDAATKAGRTVTPEEYKTIAKFVNRATGRGDLGKGAINDAALLLNSVFFAPRYVASRVQIFDPRMYARLPEGARRMAVRQAVQYFGTVAATALLLKEGFGLEVGTNPEESEFLKLKIGNTRYDLAAGQAQYVTLAARLFRNFNNRRQGKKDEFGKDALSNVKRFARYKLAPLPAAAINITEGRNAIGEETSVGKESLELVTPIFLKDLHEAYEKEGGVGMAKTMPAFVGIGVSTYGPRPNAGRPTRPARPRRRERRPER